MRAFISEIPQLKSFGFSTYDCKFVCTAKTPPQNIISRSDLMALNIYKGYIKENGYQAYLTYYLKI